MGRRRYFISGWPSGGADFDVCSKNLKSEIKTRDRLFIGGVDGVCAVQKPAIAEE